MPTYEYRCDTCGHTFEEFQAISDSPVDRCPKCGGVPRRLISGGTGLIFKGSGFYITDYRNKKLTNDDSTDGNKTDTLAKTDVRDSTRKTDSAATGTGKPSADN
jgi:putative FmdB family regulatory protein